MVTPSARLAPHATTRAAVVVAWRPTRLERTNSARPVSSSFRVWRTTAKMHIRATKRASQVRNSLLIMAPKV
jgi:hypothetical protein